MENEQHETRQESEPQVGQTMEDGTIYAGVSPDTQSGLCVLPADAPTVLQWKQAIDYAANFEGYGCQAGTFRLPTRSELTELFQHRAAIGGFNQDTPPVPRVFDFEAPRTPSQSVGSAISPERAQRFFSALSENVTFHAGRYWSSTEAPPESGNDLVWTQVFSKGGERGWFPIQPDPSAVRLVLDLE